MPVVKCPFSGCKYNSSNIIARAGVCQCDGTIELIQVDGYELMDCTQFEPKPLEEMEEAIKTCASSTIG